jgi:isoleucyl-tRNA synthetase
MWRGLTGGRSIHLEAWPDAEEFADESALVSQMDLVRAIASAALALRKAKGMRVRLPLAKIQIAVKDPSALEAHVELLAEELNVKSVELFEASDTDAAARGISRQLVLNARALGPRIGGKVQDLIAAAKRGDWELDAEGLPKVAGQLLVPGEFELQLQVADNAGTIQVALIPEGYLLLDTAVSPELEAEGMARDAIRLVQQARRDAGLDVSDRIELRLVSDEAGLAALATHQELISAETLATNLQLASGPATGDSRIGADTPIQISLAKA